MSGRHRGRVGPRVRLYQTVRTAHLERASELAPATILYAGRRSDFDPAVAEGLDLVRAGALRAAGLLVTSDVRVLEVNEPWMLSSSRRTAVALMGLAVGDLLRRRRTLVVTYAIENDERLARPRQAGLRARLRETVDRMLARGNARRLDRVVYGTDGARALYRRTLPGLDRRARTAVVPALPAACACLGTAGAIDEQVRTGRLLFLGALHPRKGLETVLRAWPQVAVDVPGAQLTVIGDGPLRGAVEHLAEERPDVRLVVSPPRERIHEALRTHAVLALPSRPTQRWREQVGLPLVEGLSHGCTVVTTTETGLASWLDAHDHRVLDVSASPEALAAALADALRRPRRPADVLAELPNQDGRLLADDVLFDAECP